MWPIHTNGNMWRKLFRIIAFAVKWDTIGSQKTRKIPIFIQKYNNICTTYREYHYRNCMEFQDQIEPFGNQELAVSSDNRHHEEHPKHASDCDLNEKWKKTIIIIGLKTTQILVTAHTNYATLFTMHIINITSLHYLPISFQCLFIFLAPPTYLLHE